MPWILLGVYAFVFAAFLAAAAFLRRRGRKDRKPFPDNLKLLRGPGETLRRRVARIDEDLLFYFSLAFCLPVLVSIPFLWVTTHLTGAAQLAGLALSLLALIGGLAFAARKLVRLLDEWRNRYLGYFGERIVAEALEPLKAQGCRLFHDLPAGEGKNAFNIDHVIVGPSGVFAVETKTRRKGRARSGFADHQIIYDGNVLSYPWAEDRFGLDQAVQRARWLETHLAKLLGERTPVEPLLTFPGWTVLQRARGPVNVLNPAQIPAAVVLRGAPVLDARQIELISNDLDSRCRDVEF